MEFFSPFGTTTCGLAESQFAEMGSKNFAIESLWVIIKPFLYQPLDSLTHEYWLWMKKYHMLDYDLEYKHCHREPCPSSKRYCHVPGTMFKSSKFVFTVLLSQLHQDDTELVRSVFRSVSPLPHFMCYEESSSIRRVLCGISCEAFCKFMGCCLQKRYIQRRQIHIQTKCVFW